MKKGLVLLFIFLFCFAFSNTALAVSGGFNTAGESAAAAADYDSSGNLSTTPFIRNVTVENMWGLTCLIGYIPSCTTNPAQTMNYYKNSALGSISSYVTDIYANKPASVGNYLADIGQRAGIVKPAYAQGIGFSGLTPLIGLWRGFRNIAYGFLIIIMVVIGFMLLFRMRIDPRTVISIQNSIPRIITTLLLITFSYAIVGILIDLMYLFIYVSVIALGAANNTDTFSRLAGDSFGNLYGAVAVNSPAIVDDLTAMFPIGLRAPVEGFLTAVGARFLLGEVTVFGTSIPIVPAAFTFGAATTSLGYSPLILLIVLLSLLFTYIRILFILISSYVQVIISLIFGPIQLMFGAIPNVNTFGSWIRNIISNLIVFPVILLLLTLAIILSNTALGDRGKLWTPPGVPESVAHGASGIIAFGILMTIPEIVGGIKKVLKASPFLPGGVGSVLGPVSSVYGTGMGAVSQLYYIKQIQGATAGAGGALGGLAKTFGIGQK